MCFCGDPWPQPDHPTQPSLPTVEFRRKSGRNSERRRGCHAPGSILVVQLSIAPGSQRCDPIFPCSLRRARGNCFSSRDQQSVYGVSKTSTGARSSMSAEVPLAGRSHEDECDTVFLTWSGSISSCAQFLKHES